MTPSAVLKARLTEPQILRVPGVYDAFGASMAEKAGIEALYVSGASIAYTQLGRPDIGLTTLTEVTDVVRRITERVALPIIVDADTGFGNAMNVQRTVRVLERAGAAAIQLEDQTIPKRCGHLNGKTLVSADEMVGKLRAALDARQEMLIMARTDAIAVEGLDAAMERAERYLDAGADILFVEAPTGTDALEAVAARFGGRAPLLANMVEGGKTPDLTADQLQAMGFSLVIHPGALVRAIARITTELFQAIHDHGSTQPVRDRMIDFDQLNALLGTADILADGARYDADAQSSPRKAS